jgi:SH3 domain-containing YSC84-like protein 1
MSGRSRRRIGLGTLAALATALAIADCASAPVDRRADAARIVEQAHRTFSRFCADPDMKDFRTVLAQAKGVLIVPERNKGGFIFGGSGGVGVLVAHDAKRGDWTPPAFYGLGSASFGLQVGGSRSEVILLIMTQKALDALLVTKTKLGGEVSVAAGPVGVGSGEVGADIVTFARSRGLYAGISLEGSVIKPSDERNEAFYGRRLSPLDILVRREVASGSAQALIDEVAGAVP